MTVGFHSPLPPARTGVADYSAALHRALRLRGPVELGPGDIDLYHLGNNPLHAPIYEQALRRPGVVVIHDAVLHHFFLGTRTPAEYEAEFVHNYGPWSADLARRLWEDRARSGTDTRYFRYPMLKRVAEASLGVVVHNPAAAALVRRHAPEARIFSIPHLFEPAPTPAGFEVERLRQRLGCAGQTLLCGVFGHLRESKRLSTVLRVVDSLKAYNVRLVLAGDFVSSDLARTVGHAAQPTGYLDDTQFNLYAAAVDVCINLRYPAAGESSGIAVRLMGAGKPVIVTDGLETSDWPNSVCLRVDPGPAEQEMLTAFLLWLARDRSAARRIGANGAEFIRREHALSHVAELYWNALRHCYPGGRSW